MSQLNEHAARGLGRQSDPEPPDYLPPRPPSLVLYAILFASALALATVAFFIQSQNVSGLLINLATELAGAILILLIVERRIRASEMRFLRALPGTTRETFSEWLSPEVRQVKTYARVFAAQLNSISPDVYVPVAELESELMANRERGCVLTGHGGKSVQLQRLASRQLSEVLRRPKGARVPVLVPVHKWDEGDAVDVLRATMQSYAPVSDRIFFRLLKRGRLLCIFDGLDDSLTPRETVGMLRGFHESHPSTPLIVSTRPTPEPFLEDLPRVTMRELRREEVEHIINLRGLYRDDVID
ncbi:MAG TPA: hypothetical protein VGP08_23480 [Pyrinomonadaceae bacterium]|jgi:hypothetical protein|nr:hypothetical protein [Pyrinomonadaceae bacterium]